MFQSGYIDYSVVAAIARKYCTFVFQIHETIESINQLKIQRDFMLSFSRDPKGYIQDWLKSQSRDLKVQYCYLYACMLISFPNLKSHLRRNQENDMFVVAPAVKDKQYFVC